MTKPTHKGKVSRGGCMCCPGTKDVLDMETRLYSGFGGYQVLKDGEVFYEADPDIEWEENKTLADIEREAKKSPKSKWIVTLYTPMRGGTWERYRGKWYLTESNNGFA